MNSQWKVTNDFTTISSNGHFLKVPIIGGLPIERYESIGWSFESKVYFGFGSSNKAGMGPKWSNITNSMNYRYTNEIWVLETKNNTVSQLKTTGTPPSPRVGCAIGQLANRLYVHGGAANRETYMDFFMLDLTSNHWTSLSNYGLTRPVAFHSLSPMNLEKLMLVGGGSYGNYVSDKVMIYDASENEWNDPLPDSPALWYQKALVCNSNEVLLFGGVVNKANDRFSTAVIAVNGTPHYGPCSLFLRLLFIFLNFILSLAK